VQIPRRVRPDTEKQYLQMYERRKKRHTLIDIADEFGCSMRTVTRAIDYCQSLALDMTSASDIALLIESKEDRIKWIHERIDFISGGVKWKEYSETKDGRFKKSGAKIYPTAEALFLREIRELEKDIAELKGLLNLTDDETDDDEAGLVDALHGLERARKERGK
jgi:hypothetical protein